MSASGPSAAERALKTPGSRSARAVLLGVFAILLLALPWIASPVWLLFATDVLIAELFATSLNLLVGGASVVSFGHALYYGMGAYTTALLLKWTGLPFLSALGAGAVAAALAGVLVGALCVRVSQVYFAMLTLAFAQLGWAVAFSWSELTGGDQGLTGIRYPDFDWLLDQPGFASLTPGDAYYWMVLGVVALCLFLLLFIRRSRYGLVLSALRDDPQRLDFLGVSSRLVLLSVFTLAAALAGIAGGLFSVFARGLHPDGMYWTKGCRGADYGSAGRHRQRLGSLFRRAGSPVDTAGAGGRDELLGPDARLDTWGANAGRTWRPGSTLAAAFGQAGASVTALLAAEGLAKSFGGFRALHGVCLALPPSSITAIIGPNGAGKTTLFDVLTGLRRQDRGTITLGGTEISGRSAAGRVRAGMARSFQRSSVFSGLSVLDNVRAAIIARQGEAWSPFAPLGRAHAGEADALLADVGLASRGGASAGSLAHGDRRQLELAIVLAQRPRVLLLDEPMAGMAPAETRRCAGLIERLARDRGISLLFTEHDMDVVFGMADRILVLHHGERIAEGLPADIRSDPQVRAIYLGHAA